MQPVRGHLRAARSANGLTQPQNAFSGTRWSGSRVHICRLVCTAAKLSQDTRAPHLWRRVCQRAASATQAVRHALAAALLASAISLAISLLAPTSSSAASSDAFAIDDPNKQPQMALAGDGKDRLVDLVRNFENRLDNAASGVGKSLMLSLPAMAPGTEEEQLEARDLVEEAVSVVEQVWLDARGLGLDRAAWASDCRTELAQKPPRNFTEAHLMIKDFLGRGPAEAYTRFVGRAEFKSYTKYDVTGVGLNLGTASEYVTKLDRQLPRGRTEAEGGVWVVGFVKGLAADSAGIEQGDEIIEVDGLDVRDRGPFETATLIAGGGTADDRNGGAAAPSSREYDPDMTSLRVVHASGGEPVTLRMKRGRVEAVANPVTFEIKRERGRSIGLIKLRTFNSRAVPEVKKAIWSLTERGATELMLDLSDNRGGLVNEGTEIARLFLPAGSTVFVQQGVSSSIPNIVTNSRPLTDLPLTLQVNSNSASASEILAGALQDNCRAVVVGRKTFGKGLIQSVYELKDSSGLIVVTGKYFTPAGKDIDRVGIVPDFAKLPSSSTAERALGACRLEGKTEVPSAGVALTTGR